MAFDSLDKQPPMSANAEAYSAEALRLSREAARTTRCVLDVAYGSDPAHKLDLYLPADARARDLPVLMLMHGGGWTHGYKEWMGLNAPPLVTLPAIVASVSYRLMPGHPYPAALDDCIAALAWLHANAVRWGGSPARLYVGGNSAGGQLAALVALRRDRRAAAGLPDDVVKACFAISTTFNRRMVDPALVPAEPAPSDPYAVHPDSPIAHARDARVPFFIVWGGREHERLEVTGRRMIAALEEAGTRVEHAVYPEHDHFTIHLDQRRDANPWVQRVRQWLRDDTARP
jgi:arylformamidase